MKFLLVIAISRLSVASKEFHNWQHCQISRKINLELRIKERGGSWEASASKNGGSGFDQNVNLTAICNCRGVLANVLMTPGVPLLIVAAGVPRICKLRTLKPSNRS